MLSSPFQFCPTVLLPPQRTDKYMSDDLHKLICEHLQDIFGGRMSYVSPSFNKYGRCHVNGLHLSSCMSRSDLSSFCKVYCAVNESEVPEPYFCKVEYFFKVDALIKDEDSGAMKEKDCLSHIVPGTNQTVAESVLNSNHDCTASKHHGTAAGHLTLSVSTGLSRG
eukprot:gene21179-23253_t